MKNLTSITLKLLIAVCLIGTLSDAEAGNNAGGAFNVWPDTGQHKCYDDSGEINCPAEGENFYGQDAQYQGPTRSYTKLAYDGDELIELPDDATIIDDGWIMTRDNVTGLIWEIKTDDDSIHDRDNTYTWCDTNPDTNGGYAGICGSGTDTEDFIATLNAEQFGGFSDWRLPKVKELSTLINLGATGGTPAIDIKYFPNTISDYYWSSTTDITHNKSAWFACFTDRCVNSNYWKKEQYRVRAVRGGSPALTDKRFIDNQNGTVSDRATMLMWQQDTMGNWENWKNWEDALRQCETLDLAGHDDWKLPSRNELQSIVDYSRAEPAVNYPFFHYTRNKMYWTSSTQLNNFEEALYVDFTNGMSCRTPKSDVCRVRAVRAITNISIEGTVKSYGQPVAGVEMTLMIDGNETLTMATENDGGYHFVIPEDGSDCDIIPVFHGYRFKPVLISLTLIGPDFTGQDFEAILFGDWDEDADVDGSDLATFAKPQNFNELDVELFASQFGWQYPDS